MYSRNARRDIVEKKSVSNGYFLRLICYTKDFAAIVRNRLGKGGAFKATLPQHTSSSSKTSMSTDTSNLVALHFKSETSTTLYQPNVAHTITEPICFTDPLSSTSLPKSFALPYSSSFEHKISSPPKSACSPMELVSPFPLFSYSPDQKAAKNQLKMKQVIDELIHTEESYICGLKLAKNYYFEPLFVDKTADIPLPLHSMYQCLSSLVKIHIMMLNKITTVSNHPNIYGYVLEICQIIVNSIRPFYYEEYLKIYSITIKIIDSEQFINHRTKNTSWIKGWRNYLECTQPDSTKTDLSLLSLLQRPISRVSKYQLLIELLLKYCPGIYQIQLKKSLDTIKEKLVLINESSQAFNNQVLNTRINELVNFKLRSVDFKLSSEFFGTPIRIGSIFYVYIDSGVAKLVLLPTILYKSHLILTGPKLVKGKLQINFIIDLSKCSMIKDPKGIHGGLYIDYPLSFKVEFEHRKSQMELLLVFLNTFEYQEWLESFDILINFVNGPYGMNYSQSNEKSLIIYPNTISKSDVLIEKTSHVDFLNCYFGAIQTIQIASLTNNTTTDKSISKLTLNMKERYSTEMLLKSKFTTFYNSLID